MNNSNWTSQVHYTVKPDELVQLKQFEETDCLKSFKFINLTIQA